jgi:sarcosine oxidase subunit gamma
MPTSRSALGTPEGAQLSSHGRSGVVRLDEQAPESALVLRFDEGDHDVIARVAACSGLHLAASRRIAIAEGVTALWTGPGEWRIAGRDGAPPLLALADLSVDRCTVVDTSDLWFTARLRGCRSGDVLASGCAIDVNSPGVDDDLAAWVTRLARIRALIHRVSTSPLVFDVHVERSYAAYAWAWLSDAMSEFLHS